MSETRIATDLISDAEITQLNAARSALTAAANRLRERDDWNGGACYAAADRAEYAVFMALNYLSNYGGRSMTDAQLHNLAT